ncbi:ABC transporter substrate-binding protein [Micromonospora sp. NPDC005367]|uniref:ABC transporter substrate-binding protein n=1 Tax=Micromonospora sp. NPDC005367 TaxID=3155590 RepID=UPI0033B690F7
MRLRAVLSLSVATALAVVVSGCAADEQAQDESKGDIVIGANLELSGPTASIGTTYKKALDLKVKQLNDSDAAGGRKIRLVVRDNRTDNNTSVANVNHFIKNENVTAVISGGCSACIVPAIPTITENKVPTIALASASAITSPVAERRYVFKISPNPAEDAQVIGAELKRKNLGTVGLLYVNNVYGQDGEKAVTQEAAKVGVKVVHEEQFGQADTNMTIQVSKIVAAKPAAVVIWAVMPAAGLIVKALRDAGYPGAVYLDAGAGAELFVKGTGDAAEGTNMVFPKVLAVNEIDASTPQGAAQKQWVTAYQSANGPYSGFASFAADALQTIVDAVQKADSTDREKVRDNIEAAQFDGVSGPLHFTAENHSGLTPEALGILVVRQGDWHLAG